MRLLDVEREATLENTSWLRKSAKRALADVRINEDISNDLQLALTEMAVNAINHAAIPPSTIGLRIDLKGASLRVELTDDGSPFANFASRWELAARKELAATGFSGLGLALVRQSLLNVEYHPGPPNRFIGWRPLARTRPAVLVVEDDPTLLRLYCSILKGDYRVHAAETVETALATAQSLPIDLIVSDYHVGAAAGTSLLAEIAKDAERLPVPMIVISGDSATSVRGDANQMGVEIFLTKPVNPVALKEAVARALIRSRVRLIGAMRYFGAVAERILSPPSAAELAGIGSALVMGQAGAGGGDFVIRLPGQGFSRVVMADVMGHGLQAKGASIALASVLRIIHGQKAEEPGSYLERVSLAMHDEPALSQVIATVLVADVHDDGVIVFASAGHPAPTLVSAGEQRSIDVSGVLLGLSPRPKYDSVRVELGRHERVAVVTDGVEPKFLAGGGALPQGLLDTLTVVADAPLESACAAIRGWADQALGPSPFDDWTVLLIGRT